MEIETRIARKGFFKRAGLSVVGFFAASIVASSTRLTGSKSVHSTGRTFADSGGSADSSSTMARVQRAKGAVPRGVEVITRASHEIQV